VAGWWFSSGNPVTSTNKTDCHDITEILLKVALNTITLPHPQELLKPICVIIEFKHNETGHDGAHTQF